MRAAARLAAAWRPRRVAPPDGPLRRMMCTAGSVRGAAGPSTSAMAGAALGAVGLGFLGWREWSGSEATRPSPWTVEDADVPRSTLYARYDFKKRLGKGGFGDVWLAIDRTTGRKVAIKVLSLEMQLRSMVEQEVAAMRRCGHHPNVVDLVDVVWVKPDSQNSFGEANLVMELAEGGGLFERLVSEGAYTERLASAIMQQVARAVYHLHSRGILHRDIKPENVVFATSAPDSPVQLIDFGTAVSLEEEGAKVRAGGRIGTWSYWAPEMLRQQPYDHAVDLWSLGVFMYILLVGFHPFDPDGEASEQQVLANMKAGSIPFDAPEWEDVSEQAKTLVRSMLEADPAKRCTAAELLSHPWVQGRDVPSQRLPGTHERLQAFIQARHAFYGSLLMGLLTHHLSVAAGAEGVGASKGGGEFDVLEQGWKAFDVEGKGHIDKKDLRRVCLEMGYKVSERDVTNMIMVMSPTAAVASEKLTGDGALQRAKTGEAGPADGAALDTISFERYKTTMQSSLLRRYEAGQRIFQEGDPVEGFYVITRGSCEVRVAGKGGRAPRTIAQLGPGDFFGETGLLEGREKRNATVLCTSPTEVLMVDAAVFKEVAGKGDAGSRLSASMRERAEDRQRTRLMKVLEPMLVSVQQRREYAKGQVVFQQGQAADHFYVVNAGELEMSVTSELGQQVRVKRLRPGDHFGYDALLSERHDTTVIALTPVEVTAVPRHELRLIAKDDDYFSSTAKQLAEDRKRKATKQSEAQILPMMAKAATAGGGVDYAQYESMLAGMSTVRYALGDEVFHQGDTPHSVYIVLGGTVQCEYEPDYSAIKARTSGGDKPGEAAAAAQEDAKASLARQASVRVVATLGPGDHFGETAVLEGRTQRNLTVRCVAPECELKAMKNDAFIQCLGKSSQLETSVRAAAEARTHQRIRKVLEAAVKAGQASQARLQPGEVLFRQGERSNSFYMVESGEVEMTLAPDADGDADAADAAAEPAAAIPVRRYGAGECFGASGLMPGDEFRRDTATALTEVTLRVIPHKHFRVLMKDNHFLKAGLHATNVLRSKQEQAGSKRLAEGYEDEDEVVRRAKQR